MNQEDRESVARWSPFLAGRPGVATLAPASSKMHPCPWVAVPGRFGAECPALVEEGGVIFPLSSLVLRGWPLPFSWGLGAAKATVRVVTEVQHCAGQ